MEQEYIILIVGKSGSGKSAVCRYLEDRYGMKEVKSYTTRPPRGKTDTTHIFVTQYEFDTLQDLCGYTYYNGYEYGATSSQIDRADLYVIDVNGIKYFLKKYRGRKIPIVIYIYADERTREIRMADRGDDKDSIIERIQSDNMAFAYVGDYATYTLDNSMGNMTIEELGDTIFNIIKNRRTYSKKGDEKINMGNYDIDMVKFKKFKSLCNDVSKFIENNFSPHTKVIITTNTLTVTEDTLNAYFEERRN